MKSYYSRGKKISKSNYHKDMWIIDNPDGTFHSITASEEVMLAMNPPTSKNNPKEKIVVQTQLKTKNNRPRGLANI